MKAAQELYEGVEIQGQGAVGLITYMRTDSLRLSEDAVQEAAAYIRERWGDRYAPGEGPGSIRPGPTPRTATRLSAPTPMCA